MSARLRITAIVVLLAGGSAVATGCGRIEDMILEKPPQAEAGAELNGGESATITLDNLGRESSDVLASFESRRQAEVTKLQNLAPLIIRISNESLFDAEIRAAQLKSLGVDTQGQPGTVVDVVEWAGSQKDPERLREELNTCKSKPWKSNEFPLIHRWLRAMEVDLEKLEVLPNTKYCIYFPLFRDGPLLDGAALQGTLACKVLNDALLCLAQRHAGEGNFSKAESVFLLSLQLARLQAEEPLLVDYLVATRNYEACCNAVCGYALSAPLTLNDLQRLQQSVLPYMGFEPVQKKIYSGERYRVQSVVQALQDKKLAGEEMLAAAGLPVELLGYQSPRAEVWPAVKVYIDDFFSQVSGGMSRGDIDVRKDQVQKVVTQLFDPTVNSNRPPGTADDNEARRIAQGIFKLMAADFRKLIDVEARMVAAYRMLQIQLALATFRSERGKLPNELQELDIYRSNRGLFRDPFGQDIFVYHPFGDSIMLHSVGPNGRDEQFDSNSDDFGLNGE